LNCSYQAKISTAVICKLKNQPILGNALSPGTDIRCGICRKEDSVIAVAKGAPVSVSFHRHRLYASFVVLNNSSEIKSVVTLISFGTAAWVIAAIVCLITGAESKVIWTCVAGALLGAWGIRYSKRRAKRSGI
jgi:hypothetical protein